MSGVREVARGREHLPSTSPNGGRLGLPADFLIGSDGRVLAAQYGEHVYDQWPVDELGRFVKGYAAPRGAVRVTEAGSCAPSIGKASSCPKSGAWKGLVVGVGDAARERRGSP
ncbi:MULTISPECIES: hypothetical protein [unclassified Streptomyces]|uniref:hypothetical protein n=1 Tax=unclassified Streptomyces TaxID=2593676 RepID=UPI001F36B29E|nr:MULTISPECIES: hypothetical protein [unclassified Streptomyces]